MVALLVGFLVACSSTRTAKLWIHSAVNQLPAGAGCTGRECLWCPFWKPHPRISDNRPPGLWRWQVDCLNLGHVTTTLYSDSDVPPGKLLLMLKQSWFQELVLQRAQLGLPIHLDEVVAVAIFLLLKACSDCRGRLDLMSANVDKSSSLLRNGGGELLYFFLRCIQSFM